MICLALIGKGRWGQNYLRTIKRLKNCVLPKNYIRTNDYKFLLQKKNIDGVIIATPASTHFQIAKEFLERGFNVLIEKPLTTNYQQARELLKIQKKKRNIVMVGHIYRYHPAFVKLKEQIKKIGRINYLYSEGMNYGPIRNDTTALWDWAPHDLSMILDLVKEEPISISAWEIEKKAMYSLRLNFKSGFSALINIGWNYPVKKRKLTVMGENQVLIFDDTQERKVQYIKNLDKQPIISYPHYLEMPPLTCEVLEFIGCLKHKYQPKTDLKEGLLTVNIIEKAEQSKRSGGREIKI